MKPRNIRRVLRRKTNDWLASITDEAVRESAAKDTIITGGSIASMLLGEKVNDFDIYFRTQETALAVAQYYVSLFNSMNEAAEHGGVKSVPYVDHRGDRIKILVRSIGVSGEDGPKEFNYYETVADNEIDSEQFIEDSILQSEKIKAREDAVKAAGEKYRPVFLTSNAISLTHDVQIIIRFWGSPEEIHQNFDFLHCMCYWESNREDLFSLTLPPESVIAILNRELLYSHSKYPLCSIIRTRKFLKRDWHISAGQYVKMAWDISHLDLGDMQVLEDQMVGVDAAYFYEVIAELRKHMKESNQDRIDGMYLMQLIDRIF